MNTIQRVRVAGLCGIVGGTLWFVQSVLEAVFSLNFYTPGTTAFTVTATVSTGFLALVLIGFLGIRWGGGIGGRLGIAVFGIAVFGYVLMVIGGVLTVGGVGPLTDPETAVSLIYLLGRLIAVIFTLVTGIAVALQRRWQGWTRFAPLMLGLWPVLGELLPVIVTGTQPPALLNGAWGICVALVGLATLAQTQQTHPRSVLAASHS